MSEAEEREVAVRSLKRQLFSQVIVGNLFCSAVHGVNIAETSAAFAILSSGVELDDKDWAMLMHVDWQRGQV